MYQTSLFFRIKDDTALEKYRIIEYFFKSWVDDNCNNEVDINKVTYNQADLCWMHMYRADFEHFEDATAIKLKGIPKEYQPYIEIVG